MATTEKRTVTPCWPEDKLEQGQAGRPPSMSGFSRAGIAAEAGVNVESVTKAVRETRLDDGSPYAVVRYIARARAVSLREQGIDVDAGLALLDALEERSRVRTGRRS
jgi:hypothetical protein